MLILLALPVLAVVAAMHRYLQRYAPSNLLARRVRASPPRVRSAIALLALAAGLLLAMQAVSEAVSAGAAGWLNLVVLILAWDAIKLAALGSLTIGRGFVGLLCVVATGLARAARI